MRSPLVLSVSLGVVLLAGAPSVSAQVGPVVSPAVSRGAPRISDLYDRARTLVKQLFSTHRVDRFPALIDKLARSQKAVGDKQANLLRYAHTTGGSVRTETFLKERLVDLSRAQAQTARVYQEYQAAAAYHRESKADLAQVFARMAQVEDAQRALESDYERLSQSFGTVWATVGQGDDDRAGAVPTAAAPSTPVRESGGAPESASAGLSDPAVTPENQMQATPMAPVDNDPVYKGRLAELQSILGSDSSSSDEKQAAYRKFLELKAQRNRRLRGH